MTPVFTKSAVVIPCHKADDHLATMVRELHDNGVDSVYISNDGPKWGSEKEVTDCARAANVSGVFVVPPGRSGLAAVYTHGLKSVHEKGLYGVIIEMDGGGSHHPSDLKKMLPKLIHGDIVTGCRFMPGGSHNGHWKRQALSYLGTVVTNKLNGTSFRDATSGFIAYRAKALGMLLVKPYESVGHYYQTEMRLRAVALGFKIIDSPITYDGGTGSTLNISSIGESLRMAFR